MNSVLLTLVIVTFILLIVVAGIRPRPSAVSQYELRRREKAHDPAAARAIEREQRLEAIGTVLALKVAILLVAEILLLVATFGWGWGVVFSVVVALTYGSLARTPLVKRLSQSVYRKFEPHALGMVDRMGPFLRLVRVDSFHDTSEYRRFDSREELQHMIERSGAVLTAQERSLITHGLEFGAQKVATVMTPKNVIKSIQKDEFLGPLVLSELHDHGHSRLPVIDKDLDHVVGILHLRDMLSLDNKQSATAENAMEAKVYYIHQDDTLEHALAAFLRTRHHLFIVINDQRETVGVISLEDVIEALLGRQIVDEDDNHADLRAVAAREGRSNNRPAGHVDL